MSSSAAGTMPAAMIWLTACEASSIEANVARIVRQACGVLVSRHQTLVTIASVPSLPQTSAGEVQHGRIFHRSELHDRAVAQHDLQPGHVVDGHAIFQRVRTAGVGGHVAADGRRALARRVGSEVVAGPREGLRELQVEHARLDQGQGVAEPDLQDLVHPREHDHDAAGGGVQPPASPVPAPRATTGQPWSEHIRTTSATCSAERGKTTASGMRRSTVNASQS